MVGLGNGRSHDEKVLHFRRFRGLMNSSRKVNSFRYGQLELKKLLGITNVLINCLSELCCTLDVVSELDGPEFGNLGFVKFSKKCLE